MLHTDWCRYDVVEDGILDVGIWPACGTTQNCLGIIFCSHNYLLLDFLFYLKNVIRIVSHFVCFSRLVKEFLEPKFSLLFTWHCREGILRILINRIEWILSLEVRPHV